MLGLMLWIVGVLLAMAVVFEIGSMALILAILFLILAGVQIIEYLVS